MRRGGVRAAAGPAFPGAARALRRAPRTLRRTAFALCAALPLCAALLLAGPAAAHDPSELHHATDPVAPHLLPSGAGAPPARAAAAPVRYYIGNDDHTDYMWSGDDAAYRAAFGAMLDYYMAQADATAGNGDAQGRFNCDGSIWVAEYERTRSAAQFQRLLGHLRDGTVSMPLNTLVELFGAMQPEAVLRSFYYAGRLERRTGLRFPLVIPMENQTLPGGMASLWAGAGARYAWKGVCDCATPVDVASRPRQIYRFTGHDGRSVILKWQSFQDSRSLGGYAEARDPADAVARMQSNPLWPWDVAAAFGYGWDDLQTTTDAFVAASQSLSNAGQRVIVSNEADFFSDFESAHPEALAPYGAAFGNDWDLQTATLAEVSAGVRRSVEKLRTAEALATLASIYDPSFAARLAGARDSAYQSIGLYYDHSFGPGPGVAEAKRNAWQRTLLRAIAGYVDQLHADGLARLARLVAGGSQGERHVVFNPLSWTRTDVVDLVTSARPPLHVVDVGTGVEVPSQDLGGTGAHALRILARRVPAVGYRVYEVRGGAGQPFPDVASVSLPGMDDGAYGVALGPGGALTSLVAHRGGDAQLAAPALNDLAPGGGTVALESNGPVSATLAVTGAGPPAHRTRVTLYGPEVDRVDIENRITQNFGTAQSFAFSFALDGMTMRHEEVGMIARVARQAQGGDYADEDTRTDWLTLNHFVDLSRDDRGVTLSSWDSGFFQAGNSTPDFLDATTPVVRLSAGMPAYGGGFHDQGGDASFLDRFALRAHGPWDQAAAMRFALEHQNPLVATRLSGSAGRLPPDTLALVAIGSPDVLLWALKPAEEGINAGGIVARVWNLAADGRSLSLSLPPFGIASATRVSHVETDLGPAETSGGVLVDALAREQMESYRLRITAEVDTTPPGLPPGVLLSAFPNPLGSDAPATVAYTLSTGGEVRLRVYDVRGALVATLQDGARGPGTHLASWDGSWGSGKRAAAGIYFVRLEAPGNTRTFRLAKL